MIPQNKMLEGKDQDVNSQTYQEQDREGKRETSQDEMDPEKLTQG